jgi:hypothetical protein
MIITRHVNGVNYVFGSAGSAAGCFLLPVHIGPLPLGQEIRLSASSLASEIDFDTSLGRRRVFAQDG